MGVGSGICSDRLTPNGHRFAAPCLGNRPLLIGLRISRQKEYRTASNKAGRSVAVKRERRKGETQSGTSRITPSTNINPPNQGIAAWNRCGQIMSTKYQQ